MIKTVECRTCHRTYEHRADIRTGHPYGWYSLTVNTPPEMGHADKCYRWVGIFCSVGCLMAHEEKLLEYAELARGLYDPD